MTTRLEQRLGWTFRDPGLLDEALTHSTFANENPGSGPNNERLEFLGDAALDLLVAAILFRTPGELGEGEMSRRRARVVRQSALADLARQLELGDHVRLGVGQRRSGQTEGILADAYEALIGAVFLDGGYEAVVACFETPLFDAITRAQDRSDYKTLLQEICHRRQIAIPTYQLLEVEGPDHDRLFRCEVKVEGQTLGVGEGRTKKGAEQICARLAVEALGEIASETADDEVEA